MWHGIVLDLYKAQHRHHISILMRADIVQYFCFCCTSKVVALICVAVVHGETTERVATLGQSVILPCYIDVSDDPENVPVVSQTVCHF